MPPAGDSSRREGVAGGTGRWHVHTEGARVPLERGEVLWGVRGPLAILGDSQMEPAERVLGVARCTTLRPWVLGKDTGIELWKI